MKMQFVFVLELIHYFDIQLLSYNHLNHYPILKDYELGTFLPLLTNSYMISYQLPYKHYHTIHYLICDMHLLLD